MAHYAEDMLKKTLLVVGATGRQGGAVIDAMLEKTEDYYPDMWEIIGMTRDPTQAASLALEKRGVSMVKGDCNDRESLRKLLDIHKPYAVFAVTNPFAARWTGGRPAATDTNAETAQGINLVDCSVAAGVSHFVFTSVASSHDSDPDGKGPVETFAAKAKVEDHLAKSGLSYTILGPVGFFENMTSSFAGIKQGVVPGLIKEGVNAQMIATKDIGWFARMVLCDPQPWLGKTLEIAGDNTNAWVQAATLKRIRGGGENWKVSVPPDFVFALFIPKAVGRLCVLLSPQSTLQSSLSHSHTHFLRTPMLLIGGIFWRKRGRG